MTSQYTQKDLIVLGQKIQAWNNGVKPVIFVKDKNVFNLFPLIFSDKKTISPDWENIFGYEIVMQAENPMVKENCIMFVSIMPNGRYGKVIGELCEPFVIEQVRDITEL